MTVSIHETIVNPTFRAVGLGGVWLASAMFGAISWHALPAGLCEQGTRHWSCGVSSIFRRNKNTREQDSRVHVSWTL